jgi:hypothetical protein
MSEVAAATRWQVEQVFALAPKPSSLTAAQPLAVPGRWVGTGCDDRAVWGRCAGGSAEPYECAVAYRVSDTGLHADYVIGPRMLADWRAVDTAIRNRIQQFRDFKR